MARCRYQPGDEIDDSFLGHGVVQETNVCGQRNWYSVLWDKTPDVRYNMGANPCLWIPGIHDRKDSAA